MSHRASPPSRWSGPRRSEATWWSRRTPGIEIDPPQVQNLREVHTASVPMRVAQAQYAYRFRDADWTLSLTARRRPAEIRAEVFHLQSIGEALAYGSAVVNYVITGSPLDELKFRLPKGFENVEFVGRDVRRWVQQDDVWVVKLTSKGPGRLQPGRDLHAAIRPGPAHSTRRPALPGRADADRLRRGDQPSRSEAATGRRIRRAIRQDCCPSRWMSCPATTAC